MVNRILDINLQISKLEIRQRQTRKYLRLMAINRDNPFQ